VSRRKVPVSRRNSVLANGREPAWQGPVGGLEGGDELGGGEAASGEGGGVELDADGAADAADDSGLGDLRDGLEGVVDLVGETAESEVVVGRAGEREGEDRDVVDGARLSRAAAAPRGRRSRLAWRRWLRRTRAGSISVPTL